MHETPDDIDRLQTVLDRSDAAAGGHLRAVITTERRLTAPELSTALTGIRLLVLSTVTGDGRPITGDVDGIFYRGAFHFGSSPESVRFRHLRQRPQVSATHLPGEELAVTVHGRATILDMDAPEQAEFRRTLLDIYVPRYGPEWEDMLRQGALYARIDPDRMFTFSMPPE